MNSDTLSLPVFLQFLKTIFSFPGKVLANFNKKHLKTLVYAIQHEPLHVILHNLKNLLYHSDALQQYRIRDHKAGLCLEIERIRFFQGKLEIKGWCASKNKVNKFTVETDQQVSISPITQLYRPDVGDHLPAYPNADQSGFVIVANISGATKEILLTIALEGQLAKTINIEVEEDNWEKQYQQLLAKEAVNTTVLVPSNTPKIELIELEKVGDAASSLNKKLLTSTADYFLLIAPNTTLLPNALAEMQAFLVGNPTTDLLYTDEVRINERDEQIPYFKSGFNPDLLLSTNYIGNTFLVKKSFGDQIGWFETALASNFLYYFLLKSSHASKAINHLPKALVLNENRAAQSKHEVLTTYLENFEIAGAIHEDKKLGTAMIRRKIMDNPLVSIIIPFRDNVDLLKACLTSILKKTDYPNFEILLIDNNSESIEMADFLRETTAEYSFIRKYTFKEAFNFSKINNWAAQYAKGDFLLFLNNDTEVIDSGWLTAMLSQGQRKEVGAVGAKLLYPDDTIQHAGIILGIFGVAEHSHKYFHDNSEGYFNRPNLQQNVTAVTAACLLTKKSLFQEVGGFEETDFAITLNDVDFCLKIREKGQLIVYTPYAKLYHYESKSRGGESTKAKKQRAMQEVKTFRQKWAHLIEKGDPYYNPNLSYYSTDYQLNI